MRLPCPRHVQYYAVREMLGCIREGKKRRGLIWHTQGSGKSYAMLYAANNLLERNVVGSPQLFRVVDTDKLATQMANTLYRGQLCLMRSEPLTYRAKLFPTGSCAANAPVRFASTPDSTESSWSFRAIKTWPPMHC